MKRKPLVPKGKAKKGGYAGTRMWTTHRLEGGTADNKATRPIAKPKLARFQVKRAYEEAKRTDGLRVLVDRLWPRGVTKSEAKIDVWAKDIAPTDALRKWFHTDPPKRFSSFSTKYAAELKKNPATKVLKAELKKTKGALTLVTAAKDPAHSHVPVLLKVLKGGVSR